MFLQSMQNTRPTSDLRDDMKVLFRHGEKFYCHWATGQIEPLCCVLGDQSQCYDVIKKVPFYVVKVFLFHVKILLNLCHIWRREDRSSPVASKLVNNVQFLSSETSWVHIKSSVSDRCFWQWLYSFWFHQQMTEQEPSTFPLYFLMQEILFCRGDRALSFSCHVSMRLSEHDQS